MIIVVNVRNLNEYVIIVKDQCLIVGQVNGLIKSLFMFIQNVKKIGNVQSSGGRRMDKTLEQFMKSEGWKKWEISNHGVMYYSWRKHGFEIDEEDINDLWENRRKKNA